MRHAKSSWSDYELSDFERPLNKRGKRDAPLMGEILFKIIPTPELVITSPATRAITTAHIFSEFFGIKKRDIILSENIYDAGVSDLMRIINSTSDNINILMLFGHNPTFTMTSNYLSDKSIDNIPTSGFVQIDFDLDHWNDLEGNTGKLLRFEYPKKYLL